MVDRVKLVMLGDQGSGKTSLVYRYAYDQFYNDYQGTIGIDFLSVNHTAEGRTHKVQIWDTAGQESFRSITRNFYRGSNGVFLVFDITNAVTFQGIREVWLKELEQRDQVDDWMDG